MVRICSSVDLKKLQEEMDEMILMNWKDKDKPSRGDDSLKFTTSPKARNVWLGALRILSSTEPLISVPRNSNDMILNNVADQIEKISKGIWYQSGRIAQWPVHYGIAELTGAL